MCDGVMMRSRGWLQGPRLLQRADELCRLHHFLHRAVHTASPQHETQTDLAQPLRALWHQGGASGSFKGRKDAHGGDGEDPAALGGQDVRTPWVILALPPLPASGALPLPSSWQELLLRPSRVSSPSTAGRCPSPWAGFSPQSCSGCLCPVGMGTEGHPNVAPSSAGIRWGQRALDHIPGGAAIASGVVGGRASAGPSATRGGSSEGAGMPLPTSSYGLCSVSDRYVRIKLQ